MGFHGIKQGVLLDAYGPATEVGSITYDAGNGTFSFRDSYGVSVLGSGSSIGGAVSGSTSGSVLFISSGNLNQNNANFFWDNSTIKLGIANNAPQGYLHIGSATITGLTGGPSPGYIVALDDTFSLSDGAMNALVHSGSFAQDKGGSLGFAGTYQGGNAVAMWSRISGKKENSSSGNYGGYLAFETRPFGGSITDRLHIKSTGEVQVTGTTFGVRGIDYVWPAAQSPNTFLKTDGSGNLSWATAAAALSDLTDVAVGSQIQGQYLQWDSGTSKWTPESTAAAIRTSVNGTRNYYSSLASALAAAVTGDYILYRGSGNYTVGGGGVTIAGNFTLEFASGSGVIDASSGGNVNLGADLKTINVVVATNNSSGIIHFSGDRSSHIGLTSFNPFAGTTSTAFQIDAGVKNVTAQCLFKTGGSGSTATVYLGYAAGDASSNNIVVTTETGSVFTTTDRNVSVKTTTYTAFNFDDIFANTTGGAFTITLPANPYSNWRVIISDYNGNWATANVTVARNGQNINGSASDFTLNVNNAWAEFVFVDSTQGWRTRT